MLKRIPKGTLLLIGGAEDRGDKRGLTKNREYERFEILSELIPKSLRTKRKRIEIITTASKVPTEVNEMYRDTFKKIGYAGSRKFIKYFRTVRFVTCLPAFPKRGVGA